MLYGVILNIDSVLFAPKQAPEIPYIKSFILKLKDAGLRLALVSLSPAPAIQQLTEALSLTGSFDALVSASDFLCRRSSPDMFLSGARQLGLLPSDCIVITDSSDSTQASKAAKIPCIGFIASGSQRLPLAYALLESFESADSAYLYRTHAHALGYPAEILVTKRLSVRELSMEDFPALYAMCTAPDTMCRMNEVLSDFSTELEKHRAYLSNIYPLFDLALWGVYEKQTGTLIGRAGFSLSEEHSDVYTLGYLIDAPYRRQGFATECVSALLGYAKEQGAETVLVQIKTDNQASQKVLEACDFSYHKEKSADGTLHYQIVLSPEHEP